MSTQRQPDDRVALLQGTLDLLILRVLLLGAQHGQGIARTIQQQAEDNLLVDHGSLYPALQRLEKDGLITSEWRVTDNGRRARYYQLTASGHRALGTELDSWRRFTAGLEAVLRTS